MSWRCRKYIHYKYITFIQSYKLLMYILHIIINIFNSCFLSCCSLFIRMKKDIQLKLIRLPLNWANLEQATCTWSCLPVGDEKSGNGLPTILVNCHWKLNCLFVIFCLKMFVFPVIKTLNFKSSVFFKYSIMVLYSL